MKLTYAIKYVAGMDAAVAFHRDVLGLSLKFQPPEWSEFATGEITLALHLASERKSAGVVEFGFGSDDLDACLASVGAAVVDPPREVHGVRIATLHDGDGAEFSVSGG